VTLSNWRKLPGFPVIHLGNIIRIPRDALLTWLETHYAQRNEE
jgi:hypothetical protein